MLYSALIYSYLLLCFYNIERGLRRNIDFKPAGFKTGNARVVDSKVLFKREALIKYKDRSVFV